jgi:hypothetical protein
LADVSMLSPARPVKAIYAPFDWKASTAAILG